MDYEINKYSCSSFDMNFLKFGKGERTLVIIPGISIGSLLPSAKLITDSYKAVAEEFTVYLFERIENPPMSYSIHEMAEDTCTAITGLGLKDIYLFGASQGGMISLDLVLNHKELIQRVFLAASAAKVTPMALDTVKTWISFAEKKDGKGLMHSFGKKLYPKELYEASHKLLDDLGEKVSDNDFKKFVIMANALKGYDLSDRLSEIKTGILFAGAYDDNVLGPSAIELFKDAAKTNKSFEIYVLSGYGHAFYDTAPEIKSKMLEFFIS